LQLEQLLLLVHLLKVMNFGQAIPLSLLEKFQWQKKSY